MILNHTFRVKSKFKSVITLFCLLIQQEKARIIWVGSWIITSANLKTEAEIDVKILNIQAKSCISKAYTSS